MKVTIEETHIKEIEVEANSFEDALFKVQRLYKEGSIDMCSWAEVHALVGDEDNEFEEIAVWYC